MYASDTARNVQGNITVKDGILVMESMLFTTSAAKMQLTGMYRTPRKNHLYLGMDLHLLEIEIAELLDLIPDVDSIMPMLKSFGGTGEFHLVVETYLDSLYNLKKSGKLANKSILTIADFDQASTKKRLYIIDLEHKKVLLNTSSKLKKVLAY